ncbi:MAG: hypothetical protein ACYC3U_11915, partial [Georgenia sp.]
GHANPKTTGKAGTFDWPVVDGTYRITAVSGARVASDVVRVLGGVAAPVLALTAGAVGGVPTACAPAGPGAVGADPAGIDEAQPAGVPASGVGTSSAGPEGLSGPAAGGGGAARGGTGHAGNGQATASVPAGELGVVDQPGVILTLSALIALLPLTWFRRRTRRLTPTSPLTPEGEDGTSSRPHPENRSVVRQSLVK